MNSLFKDLRLFISFLLVYLNQKVVYLASLFEAFKNLSVDMLMFKRGILQKKIWHGSMVGLSAFGIITSGAFGGQTILSASFPGVSPEDPRFVNIYDQSSIDDPVLNSLYDTRTTISQKPRSEVIEYEVKSGDTLSTIAEHFGISNDTIKWENNLDSVTIKPGQKIRILPVTGVAHTVKSGDTLESVAKKYSAEAQAILDFPFNDVPDDFKLKTGQVLIVPGGVEPAAAPVIQKSQPSSTKSFYTGVASSTFQAPGGGSFSWPTKGIITQYFAWYHPALDIADRSGPPVNASDGGTVIVAGWPDNSGYGNRVVIDHGNGYTTLYAHFSNVYVSAGEKVSRGQTIGRMGTTGRSTGTHLHFEIRYKGIALNPSSILK
ncbi:MAG: M23 family metallopeptidase [Candidatus Daviesbacteria bacterium]|nr:M23 family metallopeptidase [Candidatus Daviesbacteria bacterium]